MIATAFNSLEAIIADPLFPEVDVGLRSGCHYNLDGDVREYEFIQGAEDGLRSFYRRYGCRLTHGAEGYYYLLADGALLGQRRLSAAEMLVGQTLALMRMDPATLARFGRIPESKLLAMLEHLLGEANLFAMLARRARGKDRETDARKIREAVGSALNELQRLGFLQRLKEAEDGQILPRPAIMRFADPVRAGDDLADGLARLIGRGEAALLAEDAEQEDALPQQPVEALPPDDELQEAAGDLLGDTTP